jgi:hypothetical protein
MRMSGNLLNGITSRKRRVTSDDAANPRATLTYGLIAPVAARPRSRRPRDITRDSSTSFSYDESRSDCVGR